MNPYLDDMSAYPWRNCSTYQKKAKIRFLKGQIEMNLRQNEIMKDAIRQIEEDLLED